MIESASLQLPVADLDRALRFYVERLGVKLGADALIDLGGGFRLELVTAESPRPVCLSLQVRGELEDTVATYENRGLVFQRGSVGGQPCAECVDPDGHVLRLVPSKP